MKYSYQKLSYIENSINNFLNNTEKASRKLVFKLRQNLKKLDEAKGLIEEDFDSLSEEESSRLQDFQAKKIELIKKHGGEIKQHRNGNVEVKNYQELNSDEDFVSDLEDLSEEYEDVLDRANEIDKVNYEISQDDIAEVDWIEIDLDLFPEEMGTEFNDAFLEFTTEN